MPDSILTLTEPGAPATQTPPHARNDLFDKTRGLDRGAGRVKESLWFLVKVTFFLSPLPWPPRLRAALLRAFGAKVGRGLHTKPRLNVHFPWKLEVGDYCWLGESCELLNLEPIVLDDHVSLGHEVYMAAGSHDVASASMAYQNRPIRVGKGTWVATRAFVGPGVTVGQNSVVAACAVVVRDVPDNVVVAGNPARVVNERRITRD